MKWQEGLDCLSRNYTATPDLEIIKIRVAEATSDNAALEIIVQLGNKMLTAVCQPGPASIAYKIRFVRGKRWSE